MLAKRLNHREAVLPNVLWVLESHRDARIGLELFRPDRFWSARGPSKFHCRGSQRFSGKPASDFSPAFGGLPPGPSAWGGLQEVPEMRQQKKRGLVFLLYEEP